MNRRAFFPAAISGLIGLLTAQPLLAATPPARLRPIFRLRECPDGWARFERVRMFELRDGDRCLAGDVDYVFLVQGKPYFKDGCWQVTAVPVED